MRKYLLIIGIGVIIYFLVTKFFNKNTPVKKTIIAGDPEQINKVVLSQTQTTPSTSSTQNQTE